LTRIVEAEVLPVSVPFVEPFRISGGEATQGRHVLLRLITSDGTVGYGESAPLTSYSGRTQGEVVKWLEEAAKRLVGTDPLDLNAIHEELLRGTDPFALAAIDIASHDLAARILGVGLCKLMGGPLESSVELSWAIGFKPPESVAEEARRFAKIGFGTVKIKVGEEPDVDLERVRAAREALGDKVKLKVDANQGYDLETAIAMGEKFEELGVSVYEQPLPRSCFREFHKLRKAVGIPIMADESLFSAKDAIRIVRFRLADILNIKIMKLGGLVPSRRVEAIASASDTPCMVGSMPELGVGTLAGIHFACSSHVFRYGAELIGPWMFRDDLLENKPLLKQGRVFLPDGPGLGIEVDEGKVERYRDG